MIDGTPDAPEQRAPEIESSKLIRAEQDLDRDMVGLTRALVGWTAALFIGALIAAAIAFFQLQAMRGQLHEMQSSTSDTHNLAIATQQLAVEAKRESEAFDKLRRAAEAQSAAAATQALAMGTLRDASQLQAKETERLAAATHTQASGTHELVLLTGRLAQAASDQSKAAEAVANLDIERSRPRFEVVTTTEPTDVNEANVFFPLAFKIVPNSGVTRIDAAVAHEATLIHDGLTLCRFELDNFFVWNTSSSDFRLSEGANILRTTAAKAEREPSGFSLQHLWVDISIDYETLDGKNERQLLRFALGRGQPLNELPSAMKDLWPHVLVGTGNDGRRVVLGFETTKPLDDDCKKTSLDLDRYPSIAMTTAWALDNGQLVPVGEAKGDPSFAVLKDPKDTPN